MSTLDLSKAGAKALALFEAWKTVGLNRDKGAKEPKETYQPTDNDRLAADLSSKYDEGTLRCAAVIAALVDRNKTAKPVINFDIPKELA
jgi:hypothetical protein